MIKMSYKEAKKYLIWAKTTVSTDNRGNITNPNRIANTNYNTPWKTNLKVLVIIGKQAS